MARKRKSELSAATLGFEAELWQAADEMRGHISAAEYRQVLTGLIFLRYVSAAFARRFEELKKEGLEEYRDGYAEKNVFFIPPESRWEVIAPAAHSPEIGLVLDRALEAVERENPPLKGILPKVYASPDIDKRVLGNVVDIFTNKIDMEEMAEDRDLLGRTYEYCIMKFAEHEGKKGGEYYTPSSIVRTLVEVLRPRDDSRIYDPCCGSGGMFVQSVQYLAAHRALRKGVSIFGQEANADTWRMAKMNLAVRGINANFGPHHADTFTKDLFQTMKFDFILANPPFNLKRWGQEGLLEDVRWAYGVPPAGNANYAWIEHMIHHLAPGGKIGLVLANGALTSNQSGEGEIRQRIVEDDLVEGIVAMPTQLFYSVTIPVSLWFISKDKAQKGKTLFVDARNLGHMVDRRHRDLEEADIERIAGAMRDFQNGSFQPEQGFSAVATTEEIAAQGGVLTPGRYVGTPEDEGDGEAFGDKMGRLTGELAVLLDEGAALDDRIRKNLAAIGFPVGEKGAEAP